MADSAPELPSLHHHRTEMISGRREMDKIKRNSRANQSMEASTRPTAFFTFSTKAGSAELKTCVAPSFFAISRRSARTSAGWLNSWPMNDVEKGGERERERNSNKFGKHRRRRWQSLRMPLPRACSPIRLGLNTSVRTDEKMASHLFVIIHNDRPKFTLSFVFPFFFFFKN